ncbi:MBL fold metallo-hydrolase [Terriglobus aquaticus]|uniref:MBL fold metallo-hydrolase n=1 Tax=Terriglobus aquaticus TaxID=940139 RepID=A0ABW9KM86_9BACT|nr:MBL fold metallo-hydrolase [Terriglobus aquaticus]
MRTEMLPASKMPGLFARMLFGKEERIPKQQLGPFRTDLSLFQRQPASGLRVTWLGHSSLLVEIDGTTLLIDPVFSQRASMVQWAGPKRFFPAPLTMDELPHVDAVLLTHDHYDHLDADALRYFDKRKPLYVCSLGVETHLKRWGVGEGRIHPMNWMDRFTVPSESDTPLELTALPARHFSGRGLKRFGTLWSSFSLRTAKHHVYHGADSGWWEGFREIGETFGPFDLVMLEIGAFDQQWHEIHLGPDNALRAAQELQARVVMPIHWGLFNLAFHAWYQPPERFTEIAGAASMPVFLPEPGVPTEFRGEPANSLWWRRYMSAAAERSATHAVKEAGSTAAATVARG